MTTWRSGSTFLGIFLNILTPPRRLGEIIFWNSIYIVFSLLIPDTPATWFVSVQTISVQSVSVQSEPVQSVYVQSASVQSVSVQSVSVQSVSVQSVPVQSVPVQSVSVQSVYGSMASRDFVFMLILA